jgi:DMSO reductase anchor subunit
VHLPLTVFAVFLELAVGGVALLAWADWRREVSRGFLLLSAITLWLSGAMAFWVRQGFPLSVSASEWRALETPALIVFLAALLGYVVWVWAKIERGRTALVGLAAGAGLVALAAAALVHDSAWGWPGTLLSLLLGSAALGGSMVGMLLGHWYLVTPNLSTRPLLGMTGAFLGAAVLQGALLPLVLASASSDGAQGAAAATLLGTYGVGLGLRVLVGIVLPVALGWMTWQTCKLRSMMSATGLLYIAVSCVLAGEIAARTLFFLTGVPT